MSRANESPGARVRAIWQRLEPLPGGPWLFSRILGRMIPYSGSIRANVRHFEPGHTRIDLPDRRRVRNHLRSIHAIALANLGELTTGLALVGSLAPEVRAILVGIDIQYVKKARGTLVAEARCEVPTVTESVDHPVTADIRDASGDVVAIVRTQWRLGLARERST